MKTMRVSVYVYGMELSLSLTFMHVVWICERKEKKRVKAWLIHHVSFYRIFRLLICFMLKYNIGGCARENRGKKINARLINVTSLISLFLFLTKFIIELQLGIILWLLWFSVRMPRRWCGFHHKKQLFHHEMHFKFYENLICQS